MSAPPDEPWVVFEDRDNYVPHADEAVDVLAIFLFAQSRPDLTPTQQRTTSAQILYLWHEHHERRRRN